jgi:hypothetical protein
VALDSGTDRGLGRGRDRPVKHFVAGIGGVGSAAHLIANTHAMLTFFDDLSNARLMLAPLGVDNVFCVVILVGTVVHVCRTCLEVKARKDRAKKTDESTEA